MKMSLCQSKVSSRTFCLFSYLKLKVFQLKKEMLWSFQTFHRVIMSSNQEGTHLRASEGGDK